MENICNYICLIAPSLTMCDTELTEIADKWDIDWCTFEEFKLHTYKIWKLNRDNFKREYGMNFQHFFYMQVALLRGTPIYFKYAMKKVEQQQELNKL